MNELSREGAHKHAAAIVAAFRDCKTKTPTADQQTIILLAQEIEELRALSAPDARGGQGERCISERLLWAIAQAWSNHNAAAPEPVIEAMKRVAVSLGYAIKPEEPAAPAPERPRELLDGVPCGHPGCLNHITHPCEGCGRIGGHGQPAPEPEGDTLGVHELAGRVFDLSRDYMDHQCDSFMQTIAWIEAEIIAHDKALLAARLSPPSPKEVRFAIFSEIHAERERQDAKWGEQNHPVRPEGEARPGIKWDRHLKEVADSARDFCDAAAEEGRCTWFHILREEFCEAFAEDTPEGQRDELVQVAAVAVSIIECIDRAKRRE